MKKYLLIGLGAVALVAMLVGDGLGIAAFLRTQKESAAQQAVADTRPPVAHDRPTAAKAEFVEIPQFVVTIPAGMGANAGSVYLQLAMSFLTENKRAAADFGKLMPIVKSQIISDVMASGISPTTDAMKLKHMITADSLKVANDTIAQSDDTVGERPFLGAYITTFITQ